MSTPATQPPESFTPTTEGHSFLDEVAATELKAPSTIDENPPPDEHDAGFETVLQDVMKNIDNENDESSINDIDIEEQQLQHQRTEPQQLSPSPEKSQSNPDPLQQEQQNDEDTASLFSFDSYEKQPRIPLRLQNLLRRKNDNSATNDPGNSNTVPFPSVINRDSAHGQGGTAASGSGGLIFMLGQDVDVPCRCLFFTVKETICMVLSALGCAVFLCGLILLIMYLEGSIFVEKD